MNGGQPVPDQDLWEEVRAAWRLMREREKRARFVEHVRDYIGLPREEARRKKARR